MIGFEQVCPIDCRKGWRRDIQIPEAAGPYCTACGTPTGPEHWRRLERTPGLKAFYATTPPSRSRAKPKGGPKCHSGVKRASASKERAQERS